MNVSKTVMFWDRRRYERRGWRRDGGIWPVARMVRPLRLEDYIYGDDVMNTVKEGNALMGLAGLIEKRNG